jgi:hypothetical protein
MEWWFSLSTFSTTTATKIADAAGDGKKFAWLESCDPNHRKRVGLDREHAVFP